MEHPLPQMMQTLLDDIAFLISLVITAGVAGLLVLCVMGMLKLLLTR